MVLLDENLLKLVHDNPLYIRAHCKAILRAAIHSDAYFLSSHLIIDYSLLVGRDDTTDQLVVGIIGEGGGGGLHQEACTQKHFQQSRCICQPADGSSMLSLGLEREVTAGV